MNFPKPPALKLVQGTSRKDREAPSVELPKAEHDIPPPTTLDSFGKARWRELVTQYSDAGLLDKVDQMGLENLCMSYQRGRAYRRDEQRAEKELKELDRQIQAALAEKDFDTLKALSDFAGGTRARVQSARANQRRESATTRQYLQEFGATPGSKRRLPPAKVAENDPLLELMNKMKSKKIG